MNVRVRFPPSPTGYCHVGTARMAVLNYLFAKKHGGTIVFRSEDTDKVRSKREFEEDIKEQLQWLGLSWDEFYRTTELVSRHAAALKRLIDEDKAYVSSEPKKDDPTQMIEVVRLRNPGKIITFTDLIRGDITFDTTELGDFAIARAIDDPLYHLAVVVDDGEMGITHVIRGEDHISNTPRQILIQEAFGFERPAYAHYPLHLGADKSKLSKRTGDVAVKSYREKGFLSKALLNYIAVLGWTPPSEKEILSLDEMIDEFDIADLHKSGAVFDLEKLRWFNRQYLLKEDENEFTEQVIDIMKTELEGKEVVWSESMACSLVPLIRERISIYEDLRTLVREGEFDYFFTNPTIDATRLPDKKSTATDTAQYLAHAEEMLEKVSQFDADSVKNALWDYATEKGRGAVLWPLRYALSGKDKSPDPFTLMSILGKEESLARIAAARTLLAV